MATATSIRDISAETLEHAIDRAEELVGDLELEQIVAPAKSHKLRTAIIGLVVIALIVVVVRKVAGGGDDEPTRP